MDIQDMMKEAQASLEQALPQMTWVQVQSEVVLTHFSGTGGDWRVELIVLGHGGTGGRLVERMATATRGSVVLKLTDEQAKAAEQLARNNIMGKAP